MTRALAADLLLHAAGSLRGALTDVANAFQAAGANKVQPKWGPSGSLPDASADSARAENPGQQIVALSDAPAVGADYGLTVMNGASPAAYRFALFVMSGEGQAILARHGFAAPALL